MSGGENLSRKVTRGDVPAYVDARPRLTQATVERKRSYAATPPSPRVLLYSRLLRGVL